MKFVIGMIAWSILSCAAEVTDISAHPLLNNTGGSDGYILTQLHVHHESSELSNRTTATSQTCHGGSTIPCRPDREEHGGALPARSAQDPRSAVLRAPVLRQDPGSELPHRDERTRALLESSACDPSAASLRALVLRQDLDPELPRQEAGKKRHDNRRVTLLQRLHRREHDPAPPEHSPQVPSSTAERGPGLVRVHDPGPPHREASKRHPALPAHPPPAPISTAERGPGLARGQETTPPRRETGKPQHSTQRVPTLQQRQPDEHDRHPPAHSPQVPGPTAERSPGLARDHDPGPLHQEAESLRHNAQRVAALHRPQPDEHDPAPPERPPQVPRPTAERAPGRTRDDDPGPPHQEDEKSSLITAGWWALGLSGVWSFDEPWAPHETPPWFWRLVDQGNGLQRRGTRGHELADQVDHAIDMKHDHKFAEEMDLIKNHLRRAWHIEASYLPRQTHATTADRCRLARAERLFVEQAVDTLYSLWLRDQAQRRGTENTTPSPTPPTARTPMASAPDRVPARPPAHQSH